MKELFYLLFILCLLLFSCGSTIVDQKNSIESEQQTPVKVESANMEYESIYEGTLDEIVAEFPDEIFSAIYSVPEYRKSCTSNLNLKDKFPEFTPVVFFRELYDKQKDQVISSLREYLSSLPSEQTELTRIRYWCISFLQFKNLGKYNCYSIEIFMDALYATGMLNDLFSKFISEIQSTDSLSSSQMDQIYFEALNEISRWTEERQLSFFSKLIIGLI